MCYGNAVRRRRRHDCTREERMGNRADKGGLVTIFGAMIAVALAWELYEHLMVKPVALPILLFEVVEVFLLACIAASCIFVVDGVRVGGPAPACLATSATRSSAAATTAMPPASSRSSSTGARP